VSVDTSPPRHAEPEPPGHDGSQPGLSRRAKIGVAVVLVSLTAMWIAIAVIRLTGDDPDVLDDGATTDRAGQICSQLKDTMPPLPKDRSAEPPAARADRLDAETAVLHTMVDRLAALTWATPHDQRLVGQWLADWRQHLTDRTTYAAQVRATGHNDVAFNGAAPDGESITFRMDAFADRNAIRTCFTLDDPPVPGR
jgi:hypothetical protein